jgi:RNase H-fold protein (predicted Holliday junction resolvase)
VPPRRGDWRSNSHPCELIDERFTTALALRAVKEMAGSTRGRKGDVDALAATVLLQHALRMMGDEGWQSREAEKRDGAMRDGAIRGATDA